MPIGDSITEGKFTDGGYRQILQDMLKAGGCTVTFVGKEDDGRPENVTGFSTGMANPNHEGYGSFRIDQIMNGGSIEGHTAPPITTTLADYKPDVILMMLGTNDMLQGYQLGSILEGSSNLSRECLPPYRTYDLCSPLQHRLWTQGTIPATSSGPEFRSLWKNIRHSAITFGAPT